MNNLYSSEKNALFDAYYNRKMQRNKNNYHKKYRKRETVEKHYQQHEKRLFTVKHYFLCVFFFSSSSSLAIWASNSSMHSLEPISSKSSGLISPNSSSSIS
jgi:hypothetical protein